MAVYSMGTILKKCREMKGITQEELCYGICTASGLSKMEHGLREPSYVKFASLMERMGEWPEAYDIFIGDKVYRVNELQDKVRTQLAHYEYEAAKATLDELEVELKNFPEETIYHQFLESERIICKYQGIVRKEQIGELIELIKWTVPNFGKKSIRECFLSHQELVIINNIATGYGDNGEGEKAISILSELKEYLENSYMGNRNKATMYTVILLNLVKYLGLEGYYEKALSIANEAIDIMAEIGKTLKVAILHYDIAWIYTKMDKKKYAKEIEDELLLSLYADLSNRNYRSAELTIRFIESQIPELLESVSFLRAQQVYHRMAPAHCPKQSD